MFAPNWYESAHAKLKANYSRTMFFAAVAALAVTGVGFVFAPPYVPTPYQLRERAVLSVEVPTEIVIPPPPADVERPDLFAQDFEASDDVDAVETIAPTDFNPFEPPEIPSAPPAPEDFVAYDSPPVLIHSEAPEYPAMAMAAESEGTVHVVVVIDESGRVIQAYVSRSTANEILQQAAIEAARKFLFKPAMQRDVPVKCRIEVPFNFGLRG
ncbi:MAG: energy transducer TonB [Candidatus Eisenbacteria bacterium]|uniref:Energy transducer TonB n=1 Tax=Eiseniibacteriota bacterium TaxID=2212470 RepID=A0A938BPI2_UNCEI|nr:energy transducer TonB [Candidatus Eisenbacteria bacterium]